MVNKPKAKGTSAETTVVNYLRAHGFPQAERRALKGGADQGDVSGCLGLAIEVKYAGAGLKLGPWLLETGVERINADADHGILVVKPAGLGAVNVGSWYACMLGADFDRLRNQARTEELARFHQLKDLATVITPLFAVADGPVTRYTAATLRHSLVIGNREGNLEPGSVLALTLQPPGTKGRPEAWYRVMRLDHMVQLLHVAGYGDMEHGWIWEHGA